MVNHLIKFFKAPVIFLICFVPFLAFSSVYRITGLGKYEIITADGTSMLIASNELKILVNGPRYRISSKSILGSDARRDGVETMDEEYGCDGLDTFIVTDRPNAANNSGKGLSGIILPGRFPISCSVIVQTAWLGYCSSGYFNEPPNKTNLRLSEILSWSSPTNVTNLVVYWPGQEVPKEITGWARNLVVYHANQPAKELKQYPAGFKLWRFNSDNLYNIPLVPTPTNLTLEGFVPKPAKEATTPEDTTLIARVQFTASSIELVTDSFDPLPPIPQERFPVHDERWIEKTYPRVLLTYLSPSNGWPVRDSTSFPGMENKAKQLEQRNLKDKIDVKRALLMIILFCGLSVIIIYVIVRSIRKTKAAAKQTNSNAC